MKTTRRLLCLIIIALLAVDGRTPAVAAGPALVETTMMCTITEVAPPDAQGQVLLTIERGRVHGVRVGSRGDIWARGAGGQNAGLDGVAGRGEVVEIAEETAKLKLVQGPTTRMDAIAPGAQFDVRALLPADLHKSVLTEVYLLGVELLDNYRRPLISYGDLLRAKTAAESERALSRMVAAGREVVKFTANMKAPLKWSKWKGKVLSEVLTGATPEDYEAFLRFVRDYPGKYIGKKWKISEIFATWLINDAPPSNSDGFADLAPLAGEALRAQLARYDDAALVNLFEWVRRELSNWTARRNDEANDRLAVLQRIITARTNPVPALLAEEAHARARVLGRTPGRSLEAAAAYRDASRRYLALKSLVEAAVCRNNSADALLVAERFDDALTEARASRTLAERALAEASDAQVAAALPTKIAYAIRLEARIAKKRGNYRDVVERLTPLVGSYVKAGYGDAREDEMGLLELLAGAHRKLGQFDAARRSYAEANAYAVELQDLVRQARIAFDVADTAFDAGTYPAAVVGFEKALGLAKQGGSRAEMARAHAALGQTLWNMGRHAEAVERHQQGMALRRELGDKGNLAWQMLKVAKIRREMGDREKARDLLRQAREIRRQLGHRASEAEVLSELAELEYDLSRYTAATEAFTAARDLYRALGMAPDEATASEGLARVALALKRFDEATAHVARATALIEETGDRSQLAANLIWKATILGAAGKRDAARDDLERALAIDETSTGNRALALVAMSGYDLDDGKLEASQRHALRALALARESGDVAQEIGALTQLGRIEARRGAYDAALARADEVITLAKASGKRPALVDGMQAKAWRLTLIGRLSEARRTAEEALALAMQNDDPVRQAWVLNTLSSVQSAFGDVREELRLLDEAIPLMQKGQDPFGHSALVFNRSLTLVKLRDLNEALAQNALARKLAGSLATVELQIALDSARARALELMGRHAEAEKAFNAALAVARRSIVERVPSILSGLARVQAKEGRFDDALASLDEAVAREEAMPGAHFDALAERGITLSRAGRDAEARVALETALERAERRRGALPWEPLFHLAAIRARAGEKDPAIKTLERAVKEIERGESPLVGDDARARYHSDKTEVYHLLIKLLLGQGKVERALKYLERAKLAELSEVDRNSGVGADPLVALGAELGAQERRLQTLADRELDKRRPDQARLKNLDQLLNGVRKRRAAFVEKLDRQNALFDRFSVRPMQLEKLQRSLSKGVLVLSPVVLDDRVVIFALTRDAITHFDVAVDSTEVRRLVEQFVTEMDTTRLVRFRPMGDEDDPGEASATDSKLSLQRVQAIARRLYDLMLRRALDTLGTPETLVVSASGFLRYLPFSALLDGDTWLVERTVIVNMTSLNQDAGTHKRQARARTIMALADPDGTLGGARREVDAIRKIYRQATVFKGPEATGLVLRQLGRKRGFDVLHLATHGRLDPTNPEQSNILLADEPLFYGDIPALNLPKTRLVVLSACNTAVATGQKKGAAVMTGGTGIEIAGIAYQFQRTDIDAVVASLWKVDDQATAELMAEFYGLLKQGRRYAQALAEAQRRMANGNDESHRHPAFWAPFILMGPI